MSRTFAQINEPSYSSQYIQNKKSRTFYRFNHCQKKTSQIQNPCYAIDYSQLYINLYTKIDFANLDIPIITYLDNGDHPVQITTDVTPYLTYNIDPSGNLFGNDCGVNKYEKYTTCDLKY